MIDTQVNESDRVITPVTAAAPSSRHRRGSGSVYRHDGSNNLWIQYYRNNKRYRQSAGTTNKRKAEALLQRKLAEISNDTFVEPRSQKTLVTELAEALERDYKINGRKSLADVQTRWRLHLAPAFGELRAANVGNDDLTKYVDQRQKEGAANATINREMAVLKRAFSLGLEARKVQNAPHFPHLDERNVRKGFVEDGQYERLATACAKQGLWLRAMFEVAYNFGWRVSELLNLRVRQIDLSARTIRLEAGETRNDDARTVVMSGLVFGLIQQCVVGKQPEDHVFTRDTRDRHKPVRDFRDTWAKVCIEAGVPGLLFHDLRRSGVRNLVRRGVSERIAMTISGHRTRSVFDRYNIVSESDLREAARKLDTRDGERSALDFSHSSATVEQFSAVVANVQKVN